MWIFHSTYTHYEMQLTNTSIPPSPMCTCAGPRSKTFVGFIAAAGPVLRVCLHNGRHGYKGFKKVYLSLKTTTVYSKI